MNDPAFPPPSRKPSPMHQALTQKEAELSKKLEHLRKLLKLIEEKPELAQHLDNLLQLL